ncbi:MAG TPA: Rieske 2Fe-2S domain-containing protein [Natronosporangium sp.]|nr:Rieske 2Fe-2S domain-containing protein [Natronosporangium sp.]
MTTEPTGDLNGGTTRRTLFLGAGAVGIGAVLAACGGDDPGGGTLPAGNRGNPGGAGDPGGSNGDDGGAEQTPEGPVPLAAVDDVEVGGGIILPTENVVITQPTEGEFKAFSATCTHQGCQVSTVANGTINCFCHGSQYSIEDGSVVRSAPELTPQTQNPLSEIAVEVDGDMIFRA